MGDAEHLASPGEDQSLDQAWHLAGFAAECLRKSGLRAIGDTLGRELGHDFEGKVEDSLAWVLSIDHWAHRYALDGWSSTCGALSKWRAEHRYERTAGIDRSRELGELLRFCRARADDLLFRLFADGLVPAELR